MLDIKAIKEFLKELEEKKGVSSEVILTAIEDALAGAYKKQYGLRGQVIKSKIDLDTGDVSYYQEKEVVEDENVIDPEKYQELSKEEQEKMKEEGKVKYIDEKHILLSSAKFINSDVKAGDHLKFDLEAKEDFNRVAALFAKQTMLRKLKEIEKEKLNQEFGDLEGEIVSGTVVREDNRSYYIELKGKMEAVLPYNEQIPGEKITIGQNLEAYLLRTSELKNVVELRLSRTHPEFVKKLFEREVPELKEGLIEIKKVVREPGQRSKVAVASFTEDIDAVGSLIGHNGNRIIMISGELNGEKIDVIEYSDSLKEYIENALSPARINEIILDEEKKEAVVKIDRDQLSLAIGKSGQNVRLAARLTNCKIDIQVEEE